VIVLKFGTRVEFGIWVRGGDAVVEIHFWVKSKMAITELTKPNTKPNPNIRAIPLYEN